MNDHFHPEDSRLLDRLVDDELTDAERRELLLRLERTPDGWRRCALAFLENQAWRSESKAYVSGTPQVAVRPTPASTANRGWTTMPKWFPIATAACLMFALGVWAVVRDKDGNKIARVSVPDGGSIAVQPLPLPPAAPKSRPTTPDGTANIELVEGEVVEVPLVGPSQLDEALFGQWSQALPPEILQMLERSGHQIVRQRKLVPVDLRDGRRAVVPMDQLEIVPVGNVKRYQ
jgi:hypothetical protein